MASSSHATSHPSPPDVRLRYFALHDRCEHQTLGSQQRLSAAAPTRSSIPSMFSRISLFPATSAAQNGHSSPSEHAVPHQAVDTGSPGHRLLPMWAEMVNALPRLGAVCAVSRNQHAVLGGICVYPDTQGSVADPDALQFHYDFKVWNQGWYYHETVNGEHLAGIEFRDKTGMGFHKVVLTEDSDLFLARNLVHAFEQEPLTQAEVAEGFKANQLDGACCPKCEAALSQETQGHAAELQRFITTAITHERPLRVVLAHPGLVSVRRFIPRRVRPQGLWHSVAGDGVTLFVRTSGIGSIEFEHIHPPDVGPCELATLHDRSGNLMVSLIMEE